LYHLTWAKLVITKQSEDVLCPACFFPSSAGFALNSLIGQGAKFLHPAYFSVIYETTCS